MTPLLTDEEVEARLRNSEWVREGDGLVRDLKLKSFAAVIDYVDHLASVAEEHNHHPDILIHGWNKLRLTLSTHSEGGITELDFKLAKLFDALPD
jgi:4a-hydroxytetrahydrobiopterin dehydratase